MLRYFKLISFVCLFSLMGPNASAQESSMLVMDAHPHGAVLVDTIGATNKYSALIELPKAYLSGVCFLRNVDGKVMGCIFNEFGISALEFSYRPGEKKVKLLNVIPMMNKWYIKRVISRDLVKVYQGLLRGETIYQNEKYHITGIDTNLTPCQEAKTINSNSAS